MNYLDKLNPEQRQAVTTIEGPLLIIAGAGSGKTTVLVNRVAYMIDSGIDPKKILMLTFTNKAARNMVARAEKMTDERCKNITACTYHSFCAHILRHYSKYIDLDKDFSIITPSDAINTLKLVKARKSTYYNTHKKMPKNQIVLGILSKSINMQTSVSDTIIRYYSKYKDETPVIKELINDYQNYKTEKNMLDYDDLLIYAYQLLKNDEARNRIEKQYQYVMVDEYQDTNALQERILLLLCQKYQNLAVVGDDYQSIYAFRGSDINNILNFPDRMFQCKKVTIDTNYRSTKEILDLANHVMKEHADFGYPKMMKDNHSSGEIVHVETPINSEDEAVQIANQIEAYIKQGISLEEIAVLERGSNESINLELELQTRNIPFRKLGGLKFMEQRCVQDMLAFLKVLTNIQNDEISWFRILDIIPGIGDVYANRLVNLINNSDFLINNDFGKKKFYPYLVELNTYLQRAINAESIDIQFDILKEYYIKTMKDKIHSANISDVADKNAQLGEIEAYTKILDSLKDILMRYDTIIEFLDSIALDANPSFDETQEMVTISTIHSAKGLEWEVVFILNCINGVFPKDSVPYTESYREELRCFYVAITRAKRYLHIEFPQELEMYGTFFDSVLSSYLTKCESYYEINGMIEDKYITTSKTKCMPLRFQLVPQPLQYKNLRSELSDFQWDRIKNNVKSTGTCACCGIKTPQLDAHEVWNYNDETHTQTLDSIIPVCHQCHGTIHIGCSSVLGEDNVEQCLDWYAQCNHISFTEANDDANEAFEIWNKRNQYTWTQIIDEDILNTYLKQPPNSSNYKRRYLKVPFTQKDEAKALGARWDPQRRLWYYTGDYNTQFSKWEKAAV